MADVQAWLNEDNHRVILVDIEYHNGTSKDLLYFSNFPYIMSPSDSFTNSLGNVVSGVSYDDIVFNVPRIVSKIDQDTSIGNIEIYNTDGEYDFLLDYAFAGHRIIISIGDSTWSRAEYFTILDGTIEKFSSRTSTSYFIEVKDRRYTLDVPAQTTLIDSTYVSALLTTAAPSFTGTVTGSIITSRAFNSGLTVIPDQTVDTKVPLCFGTCFNIEPVLIDAYNHVYLIHEDQIQAVTEVRSNGVPLTLGAQYEIDLTTATIRLLVHDQGTQITCDVQGQDGNTSLGDVTYIGATPGSHVLVDTAAMLMEYLILEKTILVKENICYDSFIAYPDISALGLYVKEDTTVLSLVNQIINSTGGFLRFSRSAGTCELEINRFIDPVGEIATLTLEVDNIVEKGIRVSEIEPPKNSVTLGYMKNYTIQGKDSLAGSVVEAEDGAQQVERYSNEFITYTSLNGVIVVGEFPLAEDPDLVGTLYTNTIDATTEADRRIGIRSSKRFNFRIDSVTTPFTLSVGDIIEVVHPRFGLELGKNMIVIGLEEDVTDSRVIVEAWL